MASTVKAELDRANPVNLADLARLAELGKGLALIPRTFNGTVTANVLTLPTAGKAKQILRCWVTAGGSAGNKAVAAAESTPGAGSCAVDEDGNVVFAAADAVTAAEVTYVPVEGTLITETIPVTAGGVGTLVASKRGSLLVSATLNAPAVAAGAKIIDARGTASAAGHASLTTAGTGITFNNADAGSVTTATVSYYAVPGVGTEPEAFGDRLENSFDL